MPLVSWSKGIEVQKHQPSDERVTELDHPTQPDQGLIMDLTAGEEFLVVAEVAQKPVQLPKGFGSAVEAAGESAAGKRLGFEDGKDQGVIGLLLMPAMLSTGNLDQEQVIGDGVDQRAVLRTKPFEVASAHAAPALGCA